MATKKAAAKVKKTPFVPGVMRCDVRDKIITGVYDMTICDKWMKQVRAETPPEEAIVHVCSAKCKGRSKEFKR